MTLKRRYKVEATEHDVPAREHEPLFGFGSPDAKLIRVGPGLYAPVHNPEAFDMVADDKEET